MSDSNITACCGIMTGYKTLHGWRQVELYEIRSNKGQQALEPEEIGGGPTQVSNGERCKAITPSFSRRAKNLGSAETSALFHKSLWPAALPRCAPGSEPRRNSLFSFCLCDPTQVRNLRLRTCPPTPTASGGDRTRTMEQLSHRTSMDPGPALTVVSAPGLTMLPFGNSMQR